MVVERLVLGSPSVVSVASEAGVGFFGIPEAVVHPLGN
jgi:hypothetical protein